MAQNLPGFALELFDFPEIHEAQILFMKLQILAILHDRYVMGRNFNVPEGP